MSSLPGSPSRAIDPSTQSTANSRLGRKRRLGKRETMKRLAQENTDLKSTIANLHQQIAAIDAENAIISESLSFFQSQITVTPPGNQ
jgi:hypothetical protein